jgi:myosin heavy subunit
MIPLLFQPGQPACKLTPPPATPTPPHPQDLIRLHHMNEPSVLDTLARRYAAGDIYTRTGPGIIIAINPFARMASLYGPAMMDQYRTEGATTDGAGPRSPHIFSVASQAYWRMREEGKGQALLVRLWGPP